MIIKFKDLYKREVIRLYSLLTMDSDGIELNDLAIDVTHDEGDNFDFSFVVTSSIKISCVENLVVITHGDNNIKISSGSFAYIDLR